MNTAADDLTPQSPLTPIVPTPPVLRSEELLKGLKEVLIQHGTEMYRLKQTRSGKLILQK